VSLGRPGDQVLAKVAAISGGRPPEVWASCLDNIQVCCQESLELVPMWRSKERMSFT
jgi:hypothetical protein